MWKVELKLDKGENGLILKGEIRKKVNQLLGNEDINVRLKYQTYNVTTNKTKHRSLKNVENKFRIYLQPLS